MDKVIIFLAASFLVSLWLVPLTLLRGLVIAKLWLWHVVPIFHLEPLTISQAISVSLIVSVLTYHGCEKKIADADEVFLGPIVLNVLLLVLGWVIHVFQQ